MIVTRTEIGCNFLRRLYIWIKLVNSCVIGNLYINLILDIGSVYLNLFVEMSIYFNKINNFLFC